MKRLALCVVVGGAGCSWGPSPVLDETFSCTSTAQCVTGFSCQGGRCLPRGDGGVSEVDSGEVDGGELVDAGSDAGSDAGFDAGVVSWVVTLGPTGTLPLSQCLGPYVAQVFFGSTAVPFTSDTLVRVTSSPSLFVYRDSQCQEPVRDLWVQTGLAGTSFYVASTRPGTSLALISSPGINAAALNVTTAWMQSDAGTEHMLVTPPSFRAGECVPAWYGASNKTGALPKLLGLGIPAFDSGALAPLFYEDSACTQAYPAIVDGFQGVALDGGQKLLYVRGGSGLPLFSVAAPVKVASDGGYEADDGGFTVHIAPTRVMPAVKRSLCESFSDAGPEFDCPISPPVVEPEHTLIVVQAATDSANAARNLVVCRLVSVNAAYDTLRCSRTQAGVYMQVAVQVLELPERLNVQHIDYACDGGFGATVIPLAAPVSPQNSFVLSTHDTAQGTSAWGHFHSATVSLVNDGGAVEVATVGACTSNFAIQVASHRDAKLSANTVGLDGGLSVSFPVAAQGPNSFLTYSYRLYALGVPGLSCDRFIRGEQVSPSQLDFTRGMGRPECAGLGIEALHYQRVDLGDAGRVVKVTSSITDTGRVVNVALPGGVDSTRSIAMATGQSGAGQGLGETGDYRPALAHVGAAMGLHILSLPGDGGVRDNALTVRRTLYDAGARWSSQVIEFVP